MASFSSSRAAGMVARASGLTSVSSRPSYSCISAATCKRTLFQATSPRMKRPPARGPYPSENESTKPRSTEPKKTHPSPPPSKGKAGPRVPQQQAPTLPYRPSPFTSSSKAKQPEQPTGQPQEQQKPEQTKQQQGKGGKQKTESLDSLFSQRKLPLIGAALAAGVLGFMIMPLFVTYLKGGCSENHQHASEVPPDAVPTGLPPIGAAAFDASLDVPERMMGIKSERRKLAKESKGAVLEVAVGTGRNVGYYIWDPVEFTPDYIKSSQAATEDLLNGNRDRPQITSFTGVDLSGDALGIARTQLRVTVPAVASAIPKKAPAIDDKVAVGTEVVNVLDGKVRLIRGDAMQPLPLPADPKKSGTKYDTVVQTFGLCSVADPVKLIANMAAVVKPDTGRIVLLEHGRGWWSVVNSLLDKYAGSRFVRYGCWWNRDMEAIVAKAQEAVPGLEVVSVKQPGWLQFGTLWKIELKVAGEK